MNKKNFVSLNMLSYSKVNKDLTKEPPDTFKYSGMVLRVSADDYYPMVEIYEVCDMVLRQDSEPSRAEINSELDDYLKDARPVSVTTLSKSYFWEPSLNYIQRDEKD